MKSCPKCPYKRCYYDKRGKINDIYAFINLTPFKVQRKLCTKATILVLFIYHLPNGRSRFFQFFFPRASKPSAMKPWAEKFYKSIQWQNCREAYLKSQGYLCERCIKQGIIKPAVIVHHKIYLAPWNINDESITLNPINLEALCKDCHNKEHIDYKNGQHKTKKKKFNRRYIVGEDGAVELIPPESTEKNGQT